jgi:hypothetical protein
MSQLIPGTRSLAWVRTGLAAMVLTGSLWAVAARAQSHTPVDTPHGTGPQVFAEGPFGRAAGLGLAVDAALPDPGRLEALDAYGRGARVDLRPTVGSLADWRVMAYPEPVRPAGAGTELGSGSDSDAASIRFPASGLFLVRLDAAIIDPPETLESTAGSWVWRIAVPDRDIPGDGDPYPPAPTIMLASADQSVSLDVGSGCFVGTCGDIGATSPPRTLPTLDTLAGVPLAVRLSDGSGIAGWTVDATTIGGTDEQTLVLATGTSDPPTTSVTFAAPGAGRWVILVHVRFDRERGAYDGYARLILGPADPTAGRSRPG